MADRVTIRFIPPVDRALMGERIARAGVMTLLSDYEAHPVAVMEALTAGRPAVVSRTSGLTELADLGWAVGVDQHASAEETARRSNGSSTTPCSRTRRTCRHGRRVWLVWPILMPQSWLAESDSQGDGHGDRSRRTVAAPADAARRARAPSRPWPR